MDRATLACCGARKLIGRHKPGVSLTYAGSRSLRIEREPCIYPCIESAVERVDVLPTVIREFLCHTGTRSFVRSSTVGDNRSIVRDLIGVLIHFFGRHSNRAGQLPISLSPRRRIARIHKRELLAPVHPRRDFVDCNSCHFHNVLLSHTEKRGYHEQHKFL